MNEFLSEAYKPQEKLVFNYLLIRNALSRLLKEQKFPANIESALFKVYKNFQQNANKLIALYNKSSEFLSLGKLTSDINDEVDALFINTDFDSPLKDPVAATEALLRFITDVIFTYLDEAEEFRNSITGFNWDVNSFKRVFNQIEDEGLKYVQSNNE